MTALDTYTPAAAPYQYGAQLAITPDQAKALDEQVRQCTEAVLREGTDYGIIPGTNGEKTLWRPGAQKLLQWFRLGYICERVEIDLETPFDPRAQHLDGDGFAAIGHDRTMHLCDRCRGNRRSERHPAAAGYRHEGRLRGSWRARHDDAASGRAHLRRAGVAALAVLCRQAVLGRAPSAHERHHLDPITIGERGLFVDLPGHHVPIPFHRHLRPVDAHDGEQRRHGRPDRNVSLVAVHHDVHGGTLAPAMEPSNSGGPGEATTTPSPSS